MRLFIPVVPTAELLQTQARLSHYGYSTEMPGQRPMAGTPTSTQARKLLAVRMLECDAVAVPLSLDLVELARIAAVCQFAGRLLIYIEDLPREAPDTIDALRLMAIDTPVRCTWSTGVSTHELRDNPMSEPGRTRPTSIIHRLRRIEERINAFIGQGMKNPMTRSTRAEHYG